MTGEDIGRCGEDADPEIGDERGLEGRELLHQRRRVGKVEYPGAAGPPGDHDPEEVLERDLAKMVEPPVALVALHALAPVALDPTLHRVEQVCPHRLRAHVAAPQPSCDRVHQEQNHRRNDEEAGEIIDLLRPQLDEEEVEAPMREVDQHGLVGQAGPTIPPHERQQIIGSERDAQDRPFDAAERAMDRLRIDLLPFFVERSLDEGVVAHPVLPAFCEGESPTCRRGRDGTESPALRGLPGSRCCSISFGRPASV